MVNKDDQGPGPKQQMIMAVQRGYEGLKGIASAVCMARDRPRVAALIPSPVDRCWLHCLTPAMVASVRYPEELLSSTSVRYVP